MTSSSTAAASRPCRAGWRGSASRARESARAPGAPRSSTRQAGRGFRRTTGPRPTCRTTESASGRGRTCSTATTRSSRRTRVGGTRERACGDEEEAWSASCGVHGRRDSARTHQAVEANDEPEATTQSRMTTPGLDAVGSLSDVATRDQRHVQRQAKGAGGRTRATRPPTSWPPRAFRSRGPAAGSRPSLVRAWPVTDRGR